MPPDSTRTLSRQFLRFAAQTAAPDRDLLARFAASRDEEAFAELVRRHGPTVFAACRRVTGHAQDAEDAFQAAFLVLARRAAQIAKPDLLPNWLYGVAVRTGLEARAARRRGKEQPVSAVPDLPARESPEDDPELRAVIDEELARLPEKYRAAVVLCELEGLSRRDAAARLKVPEGTLSSRLAHARKVLAGRLARRGVSASAAAVGMVLSRDAAATSLPVSLEQATVRAAARLAVGGAFPPDLVSSRVSTLTDGVMKAMFVNRLRLTLGVGVLAFGLIGLAASGIGQSTAPRPAQNNDPFFAAGQTPRSKLDPTKVKPPEPVPAKGIEDDDVPYGSFPVQAVVRIEDGKLVVRQRMRGTFPTVKDAEDADGKKTKSVSYETQTKVVGTKHDAGDISVFDMKGNRLAAKAWRDKLKADQHVLLATDGKLPLPRELALMKDDVLLVVLPAGTGMPSGYSLPYGQGYNMRSDYVPVRDEHGTTRYELRTYPTGPAGQGGPNVEEVPTTPPPGTPATTLPTGTTPPPARP